MAVEKRRCMICGKEKEMTDTICDTCKAEIRGEAVDKHRQIRKDADRELRKEGVKPDSK
ncbi:MAG: hypothetical protein HY896_06360 [Deltaproteobacteria bacterium]|nr:hypothetical protein [Deltaproteobacteria bacterium]